MGKVGKFFKNIFIGGIASANNVVQEALDEQQEKIEEELDVLLEDVDKLSQQYLQQIESGAALSLKEHHRTRVEFIILSGLLVGSLILFLKK